MRDGEETIDLSGLTISGSAFIYQITGELASSTSVTDLDLSNNDLSSLAGCLRASMLLPGIAGPVVTVPNVDEPLCDALLFEQIPFRSALLGGATHALVLRSRPDGIATLSKQVVVGSLEQL